MATTLMQFPCDFSIKIIGKNTETFEKEIVLLARRYYPETSDDAVRCQLSKQGGFCSLSITVHATEQATLDALYNALTKHPDTHMVL
jgi:putative lipoic acid-binding regulatory protein